MFTTCASQRTRWMDGIQPSYSTQCFHSVTLSKVSRVEKSCQAKGIVPLCWREFPLLNRKQVEHSSHCLSYMMGGFPNYMNLCTQGLKNTISSKGKPTRWFISVNNYPRLTTLHPHSSGVKSYLRCLLMQY